jgi:hypothetical protein
MARRERPAAAVPAAKQRRLDGADRQRQRFPWLMPAIVVVAALVVIGGITWAIALGHLF